MQEEGLASYKIRGYNEKGILIDDKAYQNTILFNPNNFSVLSNVKNLDTLSKKDLTPHLDGIEMVLLTGAFNYQHPLVQQLIQHSIAIEFMNPQSALETTIILLSEARKFITVIFEEDVFKET